MKTKVLPLIILMSFAMLVSAQIIHVPADQPTIQDGINAAANGDTVLVDTGTYVENINYLGKNIVIASHYLLTRDTSIIDNTIIKSWDYYMPAVSVINNEDSTALLCGFTVTAYEIRCDGGYGIECDNSSPRFRDLKIQCGGSCESYGLKCDSSNLIFENVLFQYGGGQSSEAIGIRNSTVTFQGSTIKNNWCPDMGSVIACYNSILNIYNSTIENNNNGIGCNNSTLSIKNSLILNNSGPGISCSNSTLNIENSQISNNAGSGIRCWNSDLIAINTGITGNTEYYEEFQGGGGGLSSSGSNIFLQNVTITDNRSVLEGGGIYSENDSSFVFDSINRCNIYNNFSPSEGNDIYSVTQMAVVVDTFSVLNPSSTQAAPIENFSFDINHGLHTPVSADLYVSPEGDNRNSGLTADDPLKNICIALTYMITDSLNPHTLHLLPGTYSQTGSNEWFPVQMKDYLNIEGTGQNEVVLSAGNITKIQIENSVSNYLSGFTVEDRGYGIYCENSSPVLSDIIVTNSDGIKCVSSNPEISDMIITNTQYNSPGIELDSSDAIINNIEISHNNYSRGISCSYSNPVITNSVISHNAGGIYLFHSDPVLTDVELTDNEIRLGFGAGGGIYCYYSNPVLNNVDISRNKIFCSGSVKGGGLYCYCSNPVLNNVVISENICNGSAGGDSGGGIYLDNSEPVFNEVVISGNISDNYGGGVYCDTNCILQNVKITGNSAKIGGGLFIKGSPIIKDVIIQDNLASSRGGGVSIGWNGYIDDSPVLDRLTIISNSAKYFGGGIHIHNASPICMNTLIADNIIYGSSTVHNYGGGVYVSNESFPIFTNLTIVNNSCEKNGGGINSSDDSQVQLINSIVWNNAPNAISGVDTNIIVSYSDIEGGWNGIGNLDNDPYFLDFGDNPYQLSDLSPCIDAGNPDTTGINTGLYDLMGNYRLWDGDLDGDTIVDMGAYEFGSVGVGMEDPVIDQEESCQILCYPNPASNTVSLVLQPGIDAKFLEIINIQGKIILHQKVSNNNLLFNVSSFPNGLYFIRLHTSKGIEIEKLIIQ